MTNLKADMTRLCKAKPKQKRLFYTEDVKILSRMLEGFVLKPIADGHVGSKEILRRIEKLEESVELIAREVLRRS